MAFAKRIVDVLERKAEASVLDATRQTGACMRHEIIKNSDKMLFGTGQMKA